MLLRPRMRRADQRLLGLAASWHAYSLAAVFHYTERLHGVGVSKLPKHMLLIKE